MAADFIAHQLEADGVSPYGESYFQPFSFPVNIFPGKVFLKTGSKKLIPGQDFIVDPGSPSINGKFRVHRLTAQVMASKAGLREYFKNIQGGIVYIDKKEFTGRNDSVSKILDRWIGALKNDTLFNPAAVLVTAPGKLVWSASTSVDRRPVVITTYELLPGDKTIFLRIDEKFMEACRVRNVLGGIQAPVNCDSLIVLTAHYDHLGMMGNRTRFPGANDNASGVALMLDLAKELYAARDSLPCSVLFIAFAGEEEGLLGSQYFVTHPVTDLKKIKFLINLDLAGTGDDGITVVNATVFKNEFSKLTALNEKYKLLPAVRSRGEACNSDHCFFYQAGVPCFFIYTLGGIQAYHDIYDRAETLPLTAYNNYFKLIRYFILSL